jgi:hypothetical protein
VDITHSFNLYLKLSEKSMIRSLNNNNTEIAPYDLNKGILE